MSEFGAIVEGYSNSRNIVERITELALSEGWEVINARRERITRMTSIHNCPDNVPNPESVEGYSTYAFECVKNSVSIASTPKIIYVACGTWNEGGFVHSSNSVGCYTWRE